MIYLKDLITWAVVTVVVVVISFFLVQVLGVERRRFDKKVLWSGFITIDLLFASLFFGPIVAKAKLRDSLDLNKLKFNVKLFPESLMKSFEKIPDSVNPEKLIKKMTGWKDSFVNLFGGKVQLIIAIIGFVVLALAIFVIMYLVREDRVRSEELDKREHLFVYKEDVFNEINKK